METPPIREAIQAETGGARGGLNCILVTLPCGVTVKTTVELTLT
jgi:hypothetical protein